MQEALKNDPSEKLEELVDSLIAMSILTRMMAISLIGMDTGTVKTAKKGERTHGKDERTGRPAYRVVRT